MIATMAVVLGLISVFAWFIVAFFFVAIVIAVLWDNYYALDDMKERVATLEARLAHEAAMAQDPGQSQSN